MYVIARLNDPNSYIKENGTEFGYLSEETYVFHYERKAEEVKEDLQDYFREALKVIKLGASEASVYKELVLDNPIYE